MGLLLYKSNEMFSSTELIRKSKTIFNKITNNEIEKAIIMRDGKPGFLLMDFAKYEEIMGEFEELKANIKLENKELKSSKNKPNKKVVKIDEYTLKTNLSIKKIEDSFLDPQSLSIWKIPGFILLLKESGFSATTHYIYLYKTIFLPLYLIGLILIAGSFTIKFTKTRARTFFLILTGIVTGFLIHILSETIYSLGVANKLPTWLASVSPSIITIMVGGFFVIHFEKIN